MSLNDAICLLEVRISQFSHQHAIGPNRKLIQDTICLINLYSNCFTSLARSGTRLLHLYERKLQFIGRKGNKKKHYT